MPRARWWVIGALSVLTLTVVLLDATGVIFQPATEPVADPVVPPTVPEVDAALPATVTPEPAVPDPTVLAQVRRLLASPSLGDSVHVVVSPLADPDRPWVERDPDAPATPASSVKLWTGATVLDAFDPSDRLATSVTWNATTRTLVLVGGGDATLQTTSGRDDDAASLTVLARQVARALTASGDADQPVRLDFDTSLFEGPAVSPDWEPSYVSSGVIAPVTALMVDQGVVDPPSLARYADPARAATETFAGLLADEDVVVSTRHRSVTADDAGATEIASARSPQVQELVERMLRDSDNQLAEALGRLAAAKQGLPASFTGAAQAIEARAQAHGIDVQQVTLVDASGLSRDDRFTASGLLDALAAGASEPELAPLLSGLAVAGFDGTLADRFGSGPAAEAAGLVRAKTGTLTGISAEAGVATSCDGDVIAFAVLADAVPDTEAARATLDRVAAALTDCP
jgi:D-alanyl-D-alanine carboxypeptidase/D-alanyl-D-alanine-endopeptidase (penicillin-binding protein 4)